MQGAPFHTNLAQGKLPPMYFSNGLKWTPIPQWAQFLMALGTSVGSYKTDVTNCRLTVGLLLPTRAFASGLIGAGIVLGRSWVDGASTQNPVERFRRICALSPGSPLNYTRGNRIYTGRYGGVVESQGIKYVKVLFAKRTSFLIPAERALQIEIVSPDAVPSFTKYATHRLPRVSPFVSDLLNSNNGHGLGAASRLDCAILGQINQLRAEFVQQLFASDRSAHNGDGAQTNHRHKGSLQQVLQTHRFGAIGGCRSDVYPVTRRPDESGESPYVVIFDKARGFVKWRSAWPRAHRIAIFDPAEPDFEGALQAFNQGQMQGTPIAVKSLELPAVPAGVELSLYQEVLP